MEDKQTPAMIIANPAQLFSFLANEKNKFPLTAIKGSVARGFQLDETELFPYLIKFQQWLLEFNEHERERAAATLHPSESAGVPYQKCPKCDGQGRVLTPPNVPGDAATWSTSTVTDYVCDVCHGMKVIPMGVPGASAVWVKATTRLPLVSDRERIFVKYNNGNVICNLVCLYDSGRFHSAEWGILPNERVEYLDESGDFKSSYVQEYKQMEEYEKLIGGPIEWTEEKVKGMNRIEVLETLRGYQELIRFLDNTIYCIEEGSAQWEERAKQAEREDATQGKEDAVIIMLWAFVNIASWDKSTGIVTLKDGSRYPANELCDIYQSKNK